MVSSELSVCAGLEVTHALYSLVIQKLKFCNSIFATQSEISWSFKFAICIFNYRNPLPQASQWRHFIDLLVKVKVIGISLHFPFTFPFTWIGTEYIQWHNCVADCNVMNVCTLNRMLAWNPFATWSVYFGSAYTDNANNWRPNSNMVEL